MSTLTRQEQKIQDLKDRLSTSRTKEIILLNQIIAIKEENERLKVELGQREAKIDALMLEFCPEEMTAWQIENYEKSQQVAEE